uniref:Uncharacterized protein n=1 Tax=Octopus bimaculoides TaxID=37653 RepID=A0A0L8GDW9_OCTBM
MALFNLTWIKVASIISLTRGPLRIINFIIHDKRVLLIFQPKIDVVSIVAVVICEAMW